MLIVTKYGPKLAKIKSVKIPMTLHFAMRLAKPNSTKRLVSYKFSWLQSPKRPLRGQSRVLEVNLGTAHDFFKKNEQKHQNKAVLSIFENSQKWTPQLRLGFWLSCAQIACLGPEMRSQGVIFYAEHVFWPKMTVYVILKLECETFKKIKNMKWKNAILSILGRQDRFFLVKS